MMTGLEGETPYEGCVKMVEDIVERRLIRGTAGWQADVDRFIPLACNGLPGAPVDWNWKDFVANCPANAAAAAAAGWSADPAASVNKFHPGATSCYREPCARGFFANQCCYDAAGNLITSGAGAGTPDIISPEHSMKHFGTDVLPYFWYGWEDYQRLGWGPTGF
jgi:hypothetical protein